MKQEYFQMLRDMYRILGCLPPELRSRVALIVSREEVDAIINDPMLLMPPLSPVRQYEQQGPVLDMRLMGFPCVKSEEIPQCYYFK